MPRRSLRRTANFGDASSSEEFLSPEEPDDVTNYGLQFSSRRIVNPYEPSTSKEATRRRSSIKRQPTARKKTSGTPVQHIRTPVTRSSVVASSDSSPDSSPDVVTQQVVGANRRKKRAPYKLRTIQQLMQSTDNLIPRLPFGRLVREIIHNSSRGTEVNRITRAALMALHESTEMYVVQQLQDAYTLTLHRGRVTLSVKDLELLRFLRGYI